MASGTISPRALALAEEMRTPMLLTPIKLATMLACATGLLGAAVGWLAPSSPAADVPGLPTGQVAFADEEPSPRTDAAGDPLPPGVRTRLGTLRGLHDGWINFIGYSGDGKYLVTASSTGTIRVLEADTGKEVRKILEPAKPTPAKPEPANPAPAKPAPVAALAYDARLLIALTADGQTLAVANLQNPGDAKKGSLITLYEVNSGKQLRQWKVNTDMSALAFAPDGKSLAAGCRLEAGNYASPQEMVIWDLEGKELRKFDGGKHSGFTRLGFSPDGKTLAIQRSLISRWDVASGKLLPPLKGAVAGAGNSLLSPNFKMAAYYSNRTKEVLLWDVENDKELRKLSGVSPIAFSPDARVMLGTLYGDDEQYIGLWDTDTGKLLHKLLNPFGIQPAFSNDGKYVALGIGTLLRQWEVATGKERAVANGHSGNVASLVLSPDGKTVITCATDMTVRAWDASTGKEQQQFDVGGSHSSVRGQVPAFSADGRYLLTGRFGRPTNLVLWDTKAAKKLMEWKGRENGIVGFALAPDGKRVASLHRDQTIHIWESLSGMHLQQFAVNSNLSELLFSPDGTTLVALPGPPSPLIAPGAKDTKDNAIRLFNVATGRLIRTFDNASSYISAAVYFGDGRTIATANQNSTISLWEVATGKERFQWKTEVPIGAFTCSADGRFLAGNSSDGTVRFWDTISGKELVQRKGHESSVTTLVLARHGKTLITGSTDGTVLVWDVPALELTRIQAVKLDAKQVEALWSDLASDDPAKAHQAMRTLAANSQQALPMLKSHLKPVAAADAKRIARLITDLDSAQFTVRKKAEDELDRSGALFEPALQHLLESKQGLETQSRARKILDNIALQPLPAELLQAVRALAILEQLDTSEARQLLESVASGGEGARLTEEARESAYATYPVALTGSTK